MQMELTVGVIDIQEESSPTRGVSLYTVTYLSGGYKVKAALAIPERETPMPALLYCRGGIKGVGKVRPERICQMAAFGYVIAAPHYRGNEGGEGRDEFGGAEREDIYAAYEWLSKMPQVITERISLYGFSRGGMMALLAAMERKHFLAAVVWGGVSDLFLTYEERIDLRRMLKRIVGHPRKQHDAYLERSPVFHAEQINCPILIIHGMEDQNVGVGHALRLAEALERHEKPHDLWLVEGASHLFEGEQIASYTRKMFAWLDQQ
ncbi:alpha/beta hydrolase family protein [Brevibacillus migulae]|uniref:alpha/beta hydrolase family protein n=1 Tax=Brevibacillus migulae TaxID=1644114 RepID=UPI0038B3B936